MAQFCLLCLVFSLYLTHSNSFNNPLSTSRILQASNECVPGNPQFCAWEGYGDSLETDKEGGNLGATSGVSGDGSRLVAGGIDQAYVYDYVEGNWETNFDFSDSIVGNGGLVNIAISNDGTVVILGAPENTDNGNDSGLVKVYENDGASKVWNQRGADLVGEPDQKFGRSVSINDDGTTIAVGAVGYAKTFEYDGANFQGQTFFGNIADDFGFSIALSGNGATVAIGAPEAAGRKGFIRAVDIIEFAFVETINGQFDDDQFGYSVAASPDGAVIGAGAFGGSYAKFFEYNGSNWVQKGLTITGASNALGASVSLSESGERVAVGAPWDSTLFPLGGAVESYEEFGTSWAKVGDNPVGDQMFGNFGAALGLSNSGERMVIACPECNDGKGEIKTYGLYDTRTFAPSVPPTIIHSDLPSIVPTLIPSSDPSVNPTLLPSYFPTLRPSSAPTLTPTKRPSLFPTIISTLLPSILPSISPSTSPSVSPSSGPTSRPTSRPTDGPTNPEEPAEPPVVVYWPFLLMQGLVATLAASVISFVSVCVTLSVLSNGLCFPVLCGYSGLSELCCAYCCLYAKVEELPSASEA